MLWSRWRRFTRLFSQATQRRFAPLKAIVFACLGGLGILLAAYGSIYAAVELSAYEVLVLPTAVVLEWQTVSEYDLIGFEVWYKAEEASQRAYKLLGKRIAQGSTQRGVTYRMDVTYALKPNTAYCFQLRELPINGERGEILNRCGYGLGISAQPTPTPTPLFTPTSTVTPTLALTSTATLTSTALLTSTPFLTGTQFFTQSPTQPFTQPLTTTVAPFPTFLGPTTTVPTNTLPIPPGNPGETSGFVFPTATPTPFNLSVLPTPPTYPQSLPTTSTLTSTLPVTVTPTATTTGTTGADTFASAAMSVPTDFLSQTMALTGTTISGSQPPYESPFASGLPTPLSAMPISATPTTTVAAVAPNPPYIVLTATPTTVAMASVPTFTPFPTMPAASGDTLLGVQVPDTQNLMIMLLCGVFSGASGLGILGLVSTLLYMRARAAIRQNRPNQR